MSKTYSGARRRHLFVFLLEYIDILLGTFSCFGLDLMYCISIIKFNSIDFVFLFSVLVNE